jgi:hypothetical protein
MAYGDLTSLADVRAWLQTGPQPYPATDDALIARLITAASQLVQSWLNRPVLSGDWQEVRDGPGSFTSEVSWVCAVQPVTAVLLVVVDGVTVPPDPTGYLPNFVPAAPGNISPSFLTPTSSLAGYVYTPSAISVRGYWVPRKRACVLLRYTAGFASVPLDIAQATIELVARKYRERTRIGEVSKSIGGGETAHYETHAFSLRDFSSDIQLLLQQYRMVMPIMSGPPTPAPTAFDPATLAAVS